MSKKTKQVVSPTNNKRKRTKADDAPRPRAKRGRTKDSLLDHIGFTTYASDLIYTFAQLRRVVRKHSEPKKHWFGGETPGVTFVKPELVLGESDTNGDDRSLTDSNLSPKGLIEFLQLNKDLLEVNKDGDFAVKKQSNSKTRSKQEQEEAESIFQDMVRRLSQQNIDIVSFDDQFQSSELVYGIGVNHTFRRIVVVFRGSVMGTRDWPTNANCIPTTLESLAKGCQSVYLSKTDLEQVGTHVKMHRGFAKYLFGLLKGKERFHSKFDKIAATLEELLHNKNKQQQQPLDGRYQLVISGHSLGGGLAQLLTFALGACEKCRSFLPTVHSQPQIVAVTYASPSVGNAAFSTAMHKLAKENIARHIRITHQGDVVPVGLTLLRYTQTGCNLHVQEGKIMTVAGFGNTERLLSQLSPNFVAHHSMPSYSDSLYWKTPGGRVNGNSKVWAWDLDTVFACVEEGTNILDLPRPYHLWTVEELKEELRRRNLKVSGKKGDIIARLEHDDSSDAK